MSDPNEVLADIRRLIETSFTAGPLVSTGDGWKQQRLTPDEVEQLAERFTTLDTWLSSGGYLPEDWASAVGLASTRTKMECREYVTKAGVPVQVLLHPGGAAVVVWRPGTDNEFVSHETERWVNNEAKAGWLIPVVAAPTSEQAG